MSRAVNNAVGLTPLSVDTLQVDRGSRVSFPRSVRMRYRMVCLVLIASASLAAQSPGIPAVALPRIEGPLAVAADSRPFLDAGHVMPTLDLKARGYIEQEFIVRGTANVYAWAADGSLTVATGGAPYVTRILVRRPMAANRFSGAVVVEPMFTPRRWDWSMMWGYLGDQILENGDAWVGITMPGALAGLQKFNPTRYAALSFKNPAPDAACPGAPNNAGSDIEDGLKWDAISQVGAVLKDGHGPFSGLKVEALYLTVQGGDLTTYMNAIHPRARLESGRPVYDGYLARSPFALTRISRCAPT